MEAQSGLKHRLKRARGRQSVAVEHLFNSNMTQVPCGDLPACCAGMSQGSHQLLTQTWVQLVPAVPSPRGQTETEGEVSGHGISTGKPVTTEELPRAGARSDRESKSSK